MRVEVEVDAGGRDPDRECPFGFEEMCLLLEAEMMCWTCGPAPKDCPLRKESVEVVAKLKA